MCKTPELQDHQPPKLTNIATQKRVLHNRSEQECVGVGVDLVVGGCVSSSVLRSK